MASNVNTLGLYSDLETLSSKQLEKNQQFVTDLIYHRKPNDQLFISTIDINNYVSYQSDFLGPSEKRAILHDLTSVKKFRDNAESYSNTKTLWLIRSSQSYEWFSKAGKQFPHEANPVQNFPAINSLMDKVNSHLSSKFNSCLVTFYPDGGSEIRIHDNCEQVMDNREPIAVVSLGTSRRIDFLHNYKHKSEDPCKFLDVDDNSLYVMKSRCQEFYRHRVPAQNHVNGPRYSLSFRRVFEPSNSEPTAMSQVNSSTSPVKTQIELFEQMNSRQVPSAPALSDASLLSNVSGNFSPTMPSAPNRSQLFSSPPVTAPLLNPSVPNEVVLSASSSRSNIIEPSPNSISAPQSYKPITLLAGTSMTRWVGLKLPSDNFTEFIKEELT